MAEDNYTTVTSLIFTGLTDRPDLQLLLFVDFFLIYGMTLLGNPGLILVIRFGPQLHCVLSPQQSVLLGCLLLFHCHSQHVAQFFENVTGVSYNGCITQYGFFVVFATTEMFPLASIAYDHYVAICDLLLYTVIMTKKICILLIAVSYLGDIVHLLIHTHGLLRLSFCSSNVINHFFCDLPPLLKLPCGDIYLNNILVFIFGTIFETITSTVVISSYLFVIVTVWKIHSAKGRQKYFSTCASHLMAVFTFRGTIRFMYFCSSSSYSLSTDKIVSVFYTLIIPMLNPFIYSLRNNDTKYVARKLLKKEVFTC